MYPLPRVWLTAYGSTREAHGVWDPQAARRARALGVGVLSGEYGYDALQDDSADRVYENSADLLRHLDEVGIRPGYSAGRPAFAG